MEMQLQVFGSNIYLPEETERSGITKMYTNNVSFLLISVLGECLNRETLFNMSICFLSARWGYVCPTTYRKFSVV